MKKLAITAIALAAMSFNAFANLTDTDQADVLVNMDIPDFIQLNGLEEQVTLTDKGTMWEADVDFQVARNGVAGTEMGFNLTVDSADESVPNKINPDSATSDFSLRNKDVAGAGVPLHVNMNWEENARPSHRVFKGAAKSGLKTTERIHLTNKENYGLNLFVMEDEIEASAAGNYQTTLTVLVGIE